MSTADRNADGYEPRFDVDYDYGRQGELWVTSVAEALKHDRVEVKRDAKFLDTGNLYVEFECRGRDGVWRPSGISVTETELWVFVLGDSQMAFVIPTAVLREVSLRLRAQGRIGQETDGSNPTKGVLLKLSHLQAHFRGRAS